MYKRQFHHFLNLYEYIYILQPYLKDVIYYYFLLKKCFKISFLFIREIILQFLFKM